MMCANDCKISDGYAVEINDSKQINVGVEFVTQRTCISAGSQNSMKPNEHFRFVELPGEIRELIYKLLLLNFVLGTMDSVTEESSFGRSLTYDLEPQILRVRKDIGKEAHQVLYGSNTFYNICQASFDDTHASTNISPLTRYRPDLTSSSSRMNTIIGNPSHRVVMRWNLMHCTTKHSSWPNSVPNSFNDFCRAIWSPEIGEKDKKYLSIYLVPQMYEQGSRRDQRDQYESAARMLPALHLLQNVKLQINDANVHQIPSIIRQNNDTVQYISAQQSWDPAEVTALIAKVAVPSYSEPVWVRYNKLLRFAQSFEHFKPWKEQIGYSSKFIYQATYNENHVMDDFEEMRGKNPYQILRVGIHPLELAMCDAGIASDEINITDFKHYRDMTLEYLKPQYHKISTIRTSLVGVLREQKTPEGIFDAACSYKNIWDSNAFYPSDDTFEAEYDALAELEILLERYAASFRRDCPLHIEVQIRRLQPTFDAIYANMPAFDMVKKAVSSARFRNRAGFRRHFRSAMTELDTWFFEMRSARKELLHWEFYQGSELDILSDSHEAIDWDVNEPGAQDAEDREGDSQEQQEIEE